MSESSLVQTPHLCLQDLLPTSAYQSYLFLFAYPQASCRISHLSKHLTCASRTHSQPQPVEILSMLISRQVVGAFTVQTPHLCLQDLLPTSACRDTLKQTQNHVIRQSTDKPLPSNDLTANMPKMKSATMWKSAVHRSAVRSNASSKFLQNYAGRRVRQPRTPNTSAARVVANLIKLNSGSLSCQEDCFTLDSHMLTSDSFFSLQTPHDQSQGNRNTTNKETKQHKTTKQAR